MWTGALQVVSGSTSIEPVEVLALAVPVPTVAVALAVVLVLVGLVAVVIRQRRTVQRLTSASEVDDFVRRARVAVGECEDLHQAFAAFCSMLRDRLGWGWAGYVSFEDDGVRVLAADAEPESLAVPGFTWKYDDHVIDARLDPRVRVVADTGATAKDLLGVRSYISVPVAVGGRVGGAVNLSSKVPNRFAPAEVELLVAVVQATASLFHLLVLRYESEAAMHRLRVLDAARTEFLGMVAHDLRSPLTVIGHMADMVAGEWTDLDETERRNYLDRIGEKARVLARNVDDILQLARIETGELSCQREVFDLSQVVRGAVEESQHLWPSHRFDVDAPEGLPLVVADERRQWQVLGNLLNNACSYSPDDETVHVSVSLSDGALAVSIRDHGPGIDPDDQVRLFDKFVRLRQGEDSMRVAGAGLGLYICRSLVVAQGGVIDVDSTLGRGATFRYTVPVAGGS